MVRPIRFRFASAKPNHGLVRPRRVVVSQAGPIFAFSFGNFVFFCFRKNQSDFINRDQEYKSSYNHRTYSSVRS